MASVIIPLFNRVELTRQCWAALCSHTPAPACEAVFVDNGSTDGTGAFLDEIARTAPERVRIIRNPENRGFAVACNQGAREGAGEVLVFLNNDVVVHAGWLEPLVRELLENPGTGVVGARLVYPDGTIQHAGVGVNRKGIPYHLFHGLHADDPLVVERRRFLMVTGACMAVRRHEFLSIGGFDEGFINGHEDVDLCLRYFHGGRDIVYRPDCVATHHESQTEGRFAHCRYNTQRTLRRWSGVLVQDDFNFLFPESERQTPSKALRAAIKLPTNERDAAPGSVVSRMEVLARDLCRMGHACEIHHNDDWGRDDLGRDVAIVIPGRVPYRPKPYMLNVLLVTGMRDVEHFPFDRAAAYHMVCCVPEAAPMLVAAGLGGKMVEMRLAGDGIEPDSLRAVTARIVGLLDATALAPVRRDSRRTVSVLMATYNRRDMLPAAIESVRAQTHREWELVIVNDGGESVADIVAAFGDDRIVYRDAGRVSRGAAVNTAFSLCTGEYVAYLDDDDLWHPDHLQRALFFIENVPGVRMTYSDTVETTAQRGGAGWEVVSSLPVKRPQVTFADLVECNRIPGISVVHHRDLFVEAGGMDATLEALFDFDLWRRLAVRTDPYHVSYATAEHFLRPSADTAGAGQITNLHLADRRRYVWNVCRIVRKPLPDAVRPEWRRAQDQARRKVQALFLVAQGDHHAGLGDHRRAAACYRLAAGMGLDLCRELMRPHGDGEARP